MCDQVSARVSIAFNDVAAYFSEEEWSRLEDWEKELYRSVMKEIHGALISLGYAIVNPDILLRIKQVEEPCGKDPQTVHCQRPQQSPQTPKSSQTQKSPQPQQLQQSQHLEKSEQLSDELEFVKALTPGSPVFNPEVSLWIKEVEESASTPQPPQPAAPQQSPLQQPEPESQRQETSSIPPPADHPFVKPDILLRIQQIEPVEETVVPEHWVFEAPARNPAPCFPVFQSVFQEDLKNEGQPCDSEEREGPKHSEIDYGSINIVTVTEVEDYPESASQHEASPDEVEEIIPVCFDDDDDDDDDDFHLPQMSLREKRFPPRYLMDGSFECDFQPDYEPMTIDPLRNPEEIIARISQQETSLGEATNNSSLYFDGRSSFQRLQRPARKRHLPSQYHLNGSVKYKHEVDEHTIPIFGPTAQLIGTSYICAVCGMGFKEKAQMFEHQMSHTMRDYGTGAASLNISIKQEYLGSTAGMDSEEAVYKCGECAKSFSNSYKLRIHRRIHTGDRPYKCLECEKSFIKNAHLKVHLRVHTGERPYLCGLCGKGFTKSYHVKIHQRTHTGERPYRCLECNKCFSVNSHLTVHQRTHTGEKPFRCHECGKTFRQKTSLVGHQKAHHNYFERPRQRKSGRRMFT